MSKELEQINWSDLLVTDAEGVTGETLGVMLNDFDDDAVMSIVLNDDGSIKEWPYYLISAPGEKPADDTPLVPVDWLYFREELQRRVDYHNEMMQLYQEENSREWHEANGY